MIKLGKKERWTPHSSKQLLAAIIPLVALF